MANAISYEFLMSLKGIAGGFAPLGTDLIIPSQFLPPGAVNNFKGNFSTETDLATEYPTGSIGDYAYVTSTGSYWYWNASLATPAWVNEEITENDYLVLTSVEQSAIPYLIVPNSTT